MRTFLEAFYQAGLTTRAAFDSGSVAQACRESQPNATIKAPPSLSHRYVDEDVGFGLVPIAALGALAGVRTPTIDALIQLASVATGRDFRASGLSLQKMGLAGCTRETLADFLENGS